MLHTPKCEENNENIDRSNVHQTLKVRDDLTLPTIATFLPEEDITSDTNPQLETIPEPVPVRLGVRQYACPVCHKVMTDSYNMKMHIMTHTGKRPFECSICGKSFIQKFKLSRHLKAVHSQK